MCTLGYDELLMCMLKSESSGPHHVVNDVFHVNGLAPTGDNFSSHSASSFFRVARGLSSSVMRRNRNRKRTAQASKYILAIREE